MTDETHSLLDPLPHTLSGGGEGTAFRAREAFTIRALMASRDTFQIAERATYRALTSDERLLIGDFIDHAADDVAEALAGYHYAPDLPPAAGAGVETALSKAVADGNAGWDRVERLARLGRVIERERDEAVDRIANLRDELEAAEARAAALEQRLALSAAPPPADSGWRAIESFHYEPGSDPPTVLIRLPDGTENVALYVPARSGRSPAYWSTVPGMWPRYNPTHWMPRPPPPADHDASEGRGGSAGVESAARIEALPPITEQSGKEE